MQAARAGVQGGGGGAGWLAGRPAAFTWPWGSGRCRREARLAQSSLRWSRSRAGTEPSLRFSGHLGLLPASGTRQAPLGSEARVPCRPGSRRRDAPACPRPIWELCGPVVLSALKRDSISELRCRGDCLPGAPMQLLGRFLVALVLQTVGAQRQDKFLGNRTVEVGVLSFHDVWNRSSCQPLEKLVDIVSEYPREVEHMFSPSCVSLRRCSGCCGDERLQCVPTQTTNVTMQLLKMNSEEQAPYVELSFVEHRKCACRPRKGILKLGRRRRPKGRSKRKWARQKLKD